MYRGKKVTIVIPTYNEPDSIAQVITDFFATGFVDEVVAVDNNAIPPTESEIKKTNARFIKETKQGYGHALMRGLTEATGDLIVMVEPDETFSAGDLHKFLLYSDDFDIVFGTRTSRATIWSGAFMPWLVRLGNWGMAKFLEVLNNTPTLTDVGCTYKLISRRALEGVKDLFPRSAGGGCFSPELMIWLLRRGKKTGLKVVEIPVIYRPRVGESSYTGSVWRAAKLGARMIPLIIKYRFIKL